MPKLSYPNARYTQWYGLRPHPVKWPSVSTLPDGLALSVTAQSVQWVSHQCGSQGSDTWQAIILGLRTRKVVLQLWDHLILTVAECHRGGYEWAFLYLFFQIFGENEISKYKISSVFAGEGSSSKENGNGYLRGGLFFGSLDFKEGAERLKSPKDDQQAKWSLKDLETF